MGENSGSQTSTGVTLTAGETYFLYVGANAAWAKIVAIGSSVGQGDLLVINETGGISVGAKASDVRLVSMTNTTATFNPYYAVIRVTPLVTSPYYLATNSGGFGSPGSLSRGWILPAGDQSHASVLGYAGTFSYPSSPTLAIGHVIRCCPAIQSESGILSSQTSKTPASTKLSWTRINSAVPIVQIDGVGTGGNVAEIAQSFPAPVGGAYVETTRIGMFGSGNFNCGGTLRVSITNTLSVPWNELGEVAGVQASWTLSGTAPTTSFVSINWVSATLTDDAGSVSFGTPTWSIGGSTVTGENLKTLAPFITPNQGEYYLRALWSQGNCGASAYVMSRYSGGNHYASGSAWTVSGGLWTEQPGQDFGGALLGIYGGNKTFEWRLNATPQNTGGATYFYLAEHQRDSNLGLSTPQSTWGGTALFGKDLFELSGSGPDCAFGGITNSLCSIKEYRLGYLPHPYNVSGQAFTVTINMNGMGRNLAYVGTLQNQPVQTHVHRIAWDYQESTGNDLYVYQLWSTDDYFAFAEFTVKECANADCSEFGVPLNNVSFSAKICGGVRNAAGTPSAEGKFNISGQDLPGCQIVVTLTGPGYAETSWSVQITSGGTHTYTLGIFRAGSTGGTAQLAATTVIFTGNTTRYIPDRVAINITRGRNADLFVGLDKVDPTSGLVQHNVLRATYWKAFDTNTFLFYYPNKARSSSQEIGLHVLWVMNDTGVVLNHTKFLILPAGANANDYDVTITADFLRGIEEKGYISAQQTFQSQFQASILAVQKSVRDQVYEDFQKVSEYGWFVIGFLLFLATVRAFRR